MKVCRLCKEPKPLDAFGNNKNTSDGKHWACRTCWSVYVNTKRHARGVKPIAPFLNRLWDNIQQCGHEAVCPYCCWPWLKGCDNDGYGFISVTNQGESHTYVVTRVVYEIWNAIPLPSDMCACHYCDNPPCSNPMHIWVGTRVENRLDCVMKK